jgi:hypothetical protein
MNANTSKFKIAAAKPEILKTFVTSTYQCNSNTLYHVFGDTKLNGVTKRVCQVDRHRILKMAAVKPEILIIECQSASHTLVGYAIHLVVPETL